MALHRKEKPFDPYHNIHIGDKFLCFKTTSFDKNPSNVIFKSGKVYESYHSTCIRDENGNDYHTFTFPFWSKCLVKITEDGIDLSTTADLPLTDKIILAKLIKQYRNG